MNMKTNPNDSAFTGTEYDGNGVPIQFNKGLTKREYFAVMAMQGIISARHLVPNKGDMEYAASIAVIAADALIAELNKEQ